ncbi:MAG: SGNH/GDSL hydrolase family protein [Planctomycetes bacterium]|nr:SGNH/GDSL hydrolase family protein [Planctomycetota bacterium]
MKRRISILGLVSVFCLLGLLSSTAQPQGDKSKGEIHVLFIGNSLTYGNDLPKMIAELAEAGKQRPMRHERETPGGCTFEKHWKDGKALAKIQSRKWDFVVLQDQSQAPLQKKDAMFDYGKKFDAEIKKHGAKTILYQTWALQNKPDDQPAISKAYLDLSKELKSGIAPVGNAWDAALKADKKLVLHTNDKKHPNITGTYLAACVFYATIYGKSPEGLPERLGKLTDEEARRLQAIAWKTVQTMSK